MKLKKYLPIFGILLFIYILVKIDLQAVLSEIQNTNIYFLLIAVFLVFIMMLSETIKWFTIARFQNIKIPFSEAFKINMIDNYYGFITPSKVGSVIRAEYLRKYTEGHFGKGLFNFIIDKVMDLSAIIFIAIIFSYNFKDKLDLPIGFFTALFLFFVFGTLFFLKKERSEVILRIIYRKLVPNRFRDQAKSSFESFYDHVPKKRYFILFFLLNLFNWIINYTLAYSVGLSLGINLPFIYYLSIFPLATLVSLIPISVAGLGTREATLISLFGLFGIAATKVFSMSIISLLIAGIIPAIIGASYAFIKKLE
ncbi:MAG TPA: lysylphosphatidylglycerol synthase transmembrane domain-containing protein [Candidatus Pacearchaeota archaeon]|nr:lysylphosphatidylglycerol synthase transmembrane domain-containing protein [Candidatus Pacearchaeota archaeon]